MFAKRAKTPVDFHNKKCFELLQRIAGAIAANEVLDSGMKSARYEIGTEEQLEFLKTFRDKFLEARFNPDEKYSEILRNLLFELEVHLGKSLEFMNNPAVKELVNMLFVEHASVTTDAIKTSELMLGSLTLGHGKHLGVSALFLAWIAFNAPGRPIPTQQRKLMVSGQLPPVLLLYLNLLHIQSDNDPEFRKLMDGVLGEYDYGQIIGVNLPHDQALKNSSKYKFGSMFAREELINMIVDLVCDYDRAFYLQGGAAMLLSNNKDQVRKMVENSMRALGMNDASTFGRDEASAVYFHFIKYEMIETLIAKYHPAYLNITTHDKHDRVNITSAYHALVKSIEVGEPLTRARFNAVLFAPEHETVRIRQDQLAILWKGLQTYIQGLKQRSLAVPAWLPDWLEKHMPQQGRENSGETKPPRARL